MHGSFPSPLIGPEVAPAHAPGLAHDLARLGALAVGRRRALRWLAGAGTLSLVGSGSSAATAASCPVTPEETAGPFPGNGSNRGGEAGIANALRLAGIVRSDIRASLGGAGGVAQGVPLTVALRLADSRAGCAGLAGHAVYLWHCDRERRYSMYSSGVTAESYLRGVQITDAHGGVVFTTIFPGCYPGRMPHLHFEVYRNAAAPSLSNRIKTSQIALPPAVCGEVYRGAAGYGASVAPLAAISFATDGVFSDGVAGELATLTGSVAAGYAAVLTVGIAG